MRETTDYVILRTETSRELNTAITPTSVTNDEPMERVVFLGSKQKAVENRQAGKIIRNLYKTHEPIVFPHLISKAIGFPDAKDWDCFLKDNLCMRCPRCLLFGAVSTSKKLPKSFPVRNFTARIIYSSAFSVQDRLDIEEIHTFNAIDELTKSTKQALGDRISVTPGALFPSIVTLRSVTPLELKLALQSILLSTRYGAETRILGGIKNDLVAIIASSHEVISPLELTLELSEDPGNISGSRIHSIITQYGENAEDIVILGWEQASSIANHALQPFSEDELELLFSHPKKVLEHIKGEL